MSLSKAGSPSTLWRYWKVARGNRQQLNPDHRPPKPAAVAARCADEGSARSCSGQQPDEADFDARPSTGIFKVGALVASAGCCKGCAGGAPRLMFVGRPRWFQLRAESHARDLLAMTSMPRYMACSRTWSATQAPCCRCTRNWRVTVTPIYNMLIVVLEISVMVYLGGITPFPFFFPRRHLGRWGFGYIMRVAYTKWLSSSPLEVEKWRATEKKRTNEGERESVGTAFTELGRAESFGHDRSQDCPTWSSIDARTHWHRQSRFCSFEPSGVATCAQVKQLTCAFGVSHLRRLCCDRPLISHSCVFFGLSHFVVGDCRIETHFDFENAFQHISVNPRHHCGRVLWKFICQGRVSDQLSLLVPSSSISQSGRRAQPAEEVGTRQSSRTPVTLRSSSGSLPFVREGPSCRCTLGAHSDQNSRKTQQTCFAAKLRVPKRFVEVGRSGN